MLMTGMKSPHFGNYGFYAYIWNIILCIMVVRSFLSHVVKGTKGFTWLCNLLIIELKKITTYSQRFNFCIVNVNVQLFDVELSTASRRLAGFLD